MVQSCARPAHTLQRPGGKNILCNTPLPTVLVVPGRLAQPCDVVRQTAALHPSAPVPSDFALPRVAVISVVAAAVASVVDDRALLTHATSFAYSLGQGHEQVTPGVGVAVLLPTAHVGDVEAALVHGLAVPDIVHVHVHHVLVAELESVLPMTLGPLRLLGFICQNPLRPPLQFNFDFSEGNCVRLSPSVVRSAAFCGATGLKQLLQN